MKLTVFIIEIISTFFYLGYLPAIPGTFASLFAIGLFYILEGCNSILALVTSLVIFLGFLVSGKAERHFNKKDPKYIVIDEVSGMLISLMYLPFYNLQIVVSGFLLFRLFDTLKVFPASRFQKLKGSLGIMSDDLVAGIYTNILLQAVFRLACFKTS